MAMAGEALNRLKDALERLDQAIDRLEAQVAAKVETPVAGGEEAGPNAVIVERLDRIIERIEIALAD
jgi:hypothetical protein